MPSRQVAICPKTPNWRRRRTRCLPGAISSNGVLHLGAQMSRALAFAHSKGVVHRDLKPSNVLMTPSGKPMLLDFNLSYDQQTSGTRVGATLPYAAPEQLRGLFRRLGR